MRHSNQLPAKFGYKDKRLPLVDKSKMVNGASVSTATRHSEAHINTEDNFLDS